MPKASKNTVSGIDQVILRSWPKVIFLYPVMIAGYACGLIQSMTGGLEESGMAESLGMVFFVVICLNLLVISFEFSRFKTLATIFFIIAVIFALLYMSTRWEVFSFMKDILQGFHLKASSSLYFGIATYLLIMLVGVFVQTRFDYWIIRSNEILHKEGFLGDVRRFPSPNLKMTKEITDVFEFLLLGAGRIVLSPASERQSIVLDHVLRVNSAERKIQDLLSSLSVEIHEDHPDEPAHGVAGF